MPESQAIISLRVTSHLWMHNQRRAELLELLRDRRDSIEEVCFFTSFTHSVLPYSEIECRAALLKAIIPEFRALGLRTGINHLCTMGHLDENLEYSLNEPWQKITDITGTVARGSYCPLDPRFQAFTRECYQALAEAAPDFIWIDDDVRMHHHPPADFTCFCELCLARFSEETGEAWTRSRALEEIHHEGESASREVRRQWVFHNRRILNDLFALIREAVDEVNPKLVLGYMPTNNLYEGMDCSGWGRTLAGSNGLPVKWRPGGGFYKDDEPLEALRKAHRMGRTAAAIPSDTTDIQYEHENFPYQMLKKSKTIFIAETAAAMAAGCTGVALNVMGTSPDPFEEFMPYFDRICEAKPFFDRLVTCLGRSSAEGIWPAITPEVWAAQIGPGSADPLPCLTELAEIGLPPAYARDGARVHLLSGDAVQAFSRETLEELLSEAVLLDGAALRHLQERGLADLIGFEVADTRDQDVVERFTDDPINGKHAYWSRDCRPSFWESDIYVLRALNDEARILAELRDFSNKVIGPVMGVFENRLGGRVAVLGYFPWTLIMNVAKSTQMKALSRWLSRDSLPAYLSSFHKIALWCRRDATGQLVIPLLNASFDQVSGARVHIAETRSLRLLRLDGSQTTLTVVAHDGPYTIVELPDLAPWELGLIV